MIHVVVPSTTTLVERVDGVTKYTAFNIHINGWLHATIRYSLLHKLAESVRLKFDCRFGGRFSLPEFPPKKLTPFGRLEGTALDERRMRIAKYLQQLVQLTDVVRSSVVERTFLEFQLESYRPASSSVNLEVLLGDGSKHVARCGVLLNTRDVMKVLAETLSSDFDLLYQHFGIFMVRDRKEDAGVDSPHTDMMPVRLLKNFESPYVSLQLANQRCSHRGIRYLLQLRRMVWDPRVQEKLLDIPIFTSLLFKQAGSEGRESFHSLIQASTEVENGQVTAVNGDVDDQLRLLNDVATQHRFLRLCSQQSSYGYEELGMAECEMPARKTQARIRVGRRQMVLVGVEVGGDIEGGGREEWQGLDHGTEWIFRATRIRIWRISQPPSVADPLTFQFEYLVGKDQFEWITIHTDQAILLSLLLQSIGADILDEHHEAAKEAARSAHSESDVISPLKIPPSSSSSSMSSPSYLQSPSSAPPQSALPHPLAGHTANSSFNMDITDDDL